jgi:site-specific DNA recombinase
MTTPRIHCAIYTRKSSEEGLEQSFNSLDAQREACEAYILSQRHEGWQVVSNPYDDGGFSGGNIERPALKRLLADIAAKRVNTVVVYKVDRLTRSLADFAKIVEQFDKQGVSFVSVTQQFNTTTSMGRLTLNVLLSFAQFEREVTGERIRDKIAASKRKGMWMGGVVPLGYDLLDHQLILNPEEAERVKTIFHAYLSERCVSKLQIYLEKNNIRSKRRLSKTGNASGGNAFSRGSLYILLQNRVYLGDIMHKGVPHKGQHAAIINRDLWDQVQEQFKANLQAERTRPRATDKSLLTGLLFDEEDNRLTPTHTNKRGKRYRYYTSQALTEKKSDAQRTPMRIPAEEIEELVLTQVKSFLRSAQRLMDEISKDRSSVHESTAIIKECEKWVTASMDRVGLVLQSILAKVIVGQHVIRLELNRSEIRTLFLGDQVDVEPDPSNPSAEEVVTIEISAEFTRFRGEVRFQLAPETGHGRTRPIPSLVRAVARAHYWREQVLSGQILSEQQIANQEGVNRRYINRLVPLAFLAPDITEAILDGKRHVNLTLDNRAAEIPSDWAGQRKMIEHSFSQ